MKASKLLEPPKKMRFYNFFFLKACVDKGRAWTSYFNELLLFSAVFELIDVRGAIWILFAYAIFCFLLGFIGYRFGLVDAESEVQNRYNPFQKEVRKKLKKKFK